MDDGQRVITIAHPEHKKHITNLSSAKLEWLRLKCKLQQQQTILIFLHVCKKIRLDNSCKGSAWQSNPMKCQALFSQKIFLLVFTNWKINLGSKRYRNKHPPCHHAHGIKISFYFQQFRTVSIPILCLTNVTNNKIKFNMRCFLP